MYEIIVIGGGHAGTEAALASSRLGNSTLLVTGNIKRLAETFADNWQIKRYLHSGITSNPFQEVKEIGLQNGALGAKICGAGGGGHLLFAVDPNSRSNLLDALKPLPGHVEYFGFTSIGCETWTQ